MKNARQVRPGARGDQILRAWVVNKAVYFAAGLEPAFYPDACRSKDWLMPFHKLLWLLASVSWMAIKLRTSHQRLQQVSLSVFRT